MKKHAWILVLLFIILGWIASFKFIPDNFQAFICGFIWTGFCSIMYGLATAEEYDDDFMSM